MQSMSFDWVLIFSYSFVPVINFAGYIPKMVSMYKSQGPVENFAYPMWILWFFGTLISLAYGVFHLADNLFCAATLANSIPIAGILGLAFYKSCGPRFEVDTRIDHHVNQIADQMHDQRNQRKDIQCAQHNRVITINDALIPEQPQTIQ